MVYNNLLSSLRFELAMLYERLSGLVYTSDLSVFHEFMPPPIGGGHQFLRGMLNEFESRGLQVENNSISRSTRACLMNSFNFDKRRLKRLLRPSVTCVHRVDGPVDVYRGHDEGVDHEIWQVNNEFADKTIFQSRYSLEKHLEFGLEFKDPVVITNAADPRIFHSDGRMPFSRNRKIRIIASSWSDNLNKGASVYQWLDENLDWDRYEFTFVGRSPVHFKSINVVPPVDSYQMADLFRKNDIFITASRYDPCSNSLIEAMSCGLPVIFLQSGGHPEIVKDAGYGFYQADEVPGLLDQLVENYELKVDLIDIPDLTKVCSLYLDVLGFPTSFSGIH